MCGIVGYIGKKIKASYLIKKLKRLEYRGYDSAGLGFISDGKIKFVKAVGKIESLEKSVPESLEVKNGIAHTRWATNGKVNEKNAHPQLSKNGVWAIVHNGIIENEEALRKTLRAKPESDTDTSVVAELLEEKDVQNIYEFIDVFKTLVGSFAIIAENKNFENTLFVAKRHSPLFISKNIFNDCFVASDPICFSDFSTEYYALEDNEFAEIKNGEIKFFDKNKNELKKKTFEIDEDFKGTEKEGYAHYMLKEIMEQKSAISRQVNFYSKQKLLEKFDKNFLKKFNQIVLVGCGTAYHASQIGAKYFQKILNINARAEMASEFIYSKPVFADQNSLFIFVSQSGETADTITALNLAKSKGATTLAITNVMYSTLAKKANFTLPICANPEIAVASTKAYTTMLTCLYIFTSYFSENKNYFDEVLKISDEVLNFNFSKIDLIAETLKKTKYCIFIGKDLDYITACEASLKLKEVAYINSLNYPSGELKHGFLALVKKNVPIIVFANEKEINQKTFNSASEAKSRGGKLVIFTNEKEIKNKDKFTVKFETKNELLLPIVSIVPAQYLAYKVSILKGIDPDKPRNLAKSVTVE